MKIFSLSFCSASRHLALLILVCAARLQGAQAQEQTQAPRVDVFHWWVSGGERASVDVIRDAALAQGIGWTEASTVGSGTARYTGVLDQRVRAGKAPSAA